MANQLVGNGPWVIDTASSTAISTDVLAIDHILCENGTTGAANDEFKVTDASATPIVLMDVFLDSVDDAIDVRMSKLPINGITVPTITHGKVTIYFR